MPLYEYKCSKCGSVYEVLQKFSDAPLTVHEGCGGDVERLISAPGLQFKGSGWYITDYARGGGKKDGGSSDGKSESKTESKTEGSSTESKSESKMESKSTPAPAKAD
jgi:putative FmdB family regulatory protein